MRRMTITEDMTPLAKKLIEQGMTKKELAEKSGVPLVTIDQWTRRLRKNPNVYQLYKVAQVLDCHIEDLIEPEREEPLIHGEHLNNMAFQYGLSREDGETDRHLADRIEKVIKE